MLMTAEELHAAYPWSEDLKFNETMLKKGVDEKAVKAAGAKAAEEGREYISCIYGVKNEKRFCFVVGNEAGEILPKFLMAKLIMIESGIAYGNPIQITTSEAEKDRLFAMVR